MSRLINLLILLALVVTNGPAVATAMCHHEDSRAHASALQSADVTIAGAAANEETNAKAASKKGAVSDAAGPLLSGYMLPSNPHAFPARIVEAEERRITDASDPASRSVSPLLEPPLA